MLLMQVVRDNTMMVPGYEHHTLQCSACPEIERRLVFNRESNAADSERVHPAQPMPPDRERETAPGVWKRAVARLLAR